MFARHDLVWLTSRGWERVRAGAPVEAADALDLWRDGGWPAVVRRAETGLPPNELAIGFALPRRWSAKRRKRASRWPCTARWRWRRSPASAT